MDFVGLFLLASSPSLQERTYFWKVSIHTHTYTHYYLGFYTTLYWQEYHYHRPLQSTSSPKSWSFFIFYFFMNHTRDFKILVFSVSSLFPQVCLHFFAFPECWTSGSKRLNAISCTSIYSFSMFDSSAACLACLVAGYSYLKTLPGRRQPKGPFQWGGFLILYLLISIDCRMLCFQR